MNLKFSIKQMLVGMVAMAFFAAAAGAGANGSALGFGMAFALAMLTIFFAVFAVIYWSVWLLFRSARVSATQSPNLNASSVSPIALESGSTLQTDRSESQP